MAESKQKRLYVTPYALFSYEDCPQRYHLQKTAGRKAETTDQRNAFTGSIVHNCWENFVKLGRTEPSQLLDLVEPTLEIHERKSILLWDSAEEREEFIENGVQSLRNSIEIVKNVGLWDPSNMLAEYQLTPASKFEIAGCPFAVGGRIDLLVQKGNNEVAVLDWKDVKSESTINYAQLGIYQYSLEARGFKVVESAFVLTRMNKFSEKLLDRRGRRDKLDKRLQAFYTGVQFQKFDAKPSIYTCRWCRYKEECNESYTHEEELKQIEAKLGDGVRGEFEW